MPPNGDDWKLMLEDPTWRKKLPDKFEFQAMIDKYFKLKTLEIDLTRDLMEQIDLTLRPDQEAPTRSMLHQVIFERPDYIVTLSHFEGKDGDFNDFACFLRPDNETVYGNSLLFGYQISPDTGKIISGKEITIDDLYYLFNQRLAPTGYLISSQKGKNQLKKFTIPEGRIELVNLKIQKMIPLQLCKYTLELHQIDDGHKEKNIIATKLLGEEFFGTGLLLFKYTEDCYESLEFNEIEKLIKISECELAKRNLTEKEISIERDENGYLIPKNRHYTINQRLKNLKIQCQICSETEKLKICTQCYRIRYCSEKCQKADTKHKDECQ
jgi:hypothetical protein